MAPSGDTLELPQAQPTDLPRGVRLGIVMDGNGRWARDRGLSVTEGHRAGGRTLRRIVEAAIDLHVAHLTVYAFSTENWRRDAGEIAGIMELFAELLDSELPELHEQGVRMTFPGRTEGVPEDLLARMTNAAAVTQGNTTLQLAIAFNYGGRAEIVDAARAAVAEVGVEGLTEDVLSEHLYGDSLGDVDLIIRTGGEHRLSNFLTWQSAYAELVFTETLWPDFAHDDLEAALSEYARRERRFGGR